MQMKHLSPWKKRLWTTWIGGTGRGCYADQSCPLLMQWRAESAFALLDCWYKFAVPAHQLVTWGSDSCPSPGWRPWEWNELMTVNLASFSKEAKALALSLTVPCCGPFASGWRRGGTQHRPLCHSCSNLQQRAASGLLVQQLSQSLHGCRLVKGAAKCQGFYLCDLPPLCRPELMRRTGMRFRLWKHRHIQELLLCFIMTGDSFLGHMFISDGYAHACTQWASTFWHKRTPDLPRVTVQFSFPALLWAAVLL